ncbi:hypothetical protein DDB_G0283239 [Dictyostelium discoideum AX4]|uniref:Uncharacterized protein n=1 Tax=Dictyostelium discoideum TaxID=44689 RepID=Q54RF9_DICDI|nr:hypothetical protein DDB_G0283239 [Dictyostelium discoideum AX4]EAL65858.1 hypothetical protein DDB_G0283239 [Dictyostelium discoideum AX4]|eukprot:XP_639186.1 hypothetical protein DDB_G0283239 [Dictyostelium discoideum AX4]
MKQESSVDSQYPIEIKIESLEYSPFQFEPLYTQTFFYDPNSDSEILKSDISLHSVFSKLFASLFVLISKLFQ